jgi:hypothetical protein
LRLILVLGLVILSHCAVVAASAQALFPDVRGPLVGGAATVGKSDAVRRLPLAAPDAEGPSVELNRRRGRPVPLSFGKPRGPDPLVIDETSRSANERTPPLAGSFTGISNVPGGSVPPDPNGDVGPHHYVQMVNTRFAIFDKTGGLLAGPTNINVLFAGLGAGSRCATDNDGDPVVVYDRLADRWLLSQLGAVDTGTPPFHVCIAISQTPDPTGSYFLYDIVVPVFPDYFKIGVWPDGYYMSTNEEGTGDVGVYALDRGRMLQGLALSPSFIRFAVLNKNFLLPSDLDGIRPPPPGSPNYFYTFTDGSFPAWGGGPDRLDLFAFHADFAVPGNSTFTALPSLNIAAFNYTVCGYFVLNCVPQPSPGQKVDAVSEWPMWRFAYRNRRSHEVLVGNFTVDVTGSQQAGIRWFELHKTGAGNWTLHQEGTHAPDANHRFMGSIASDASGNLALGYSVSSASVNPSLRYATRLADAALGTLEPEATLVAGGGVQTNGFNRWGDYSAMTVDPTDDCTFWYTGELYLVTSGSSWRTQIGNFKIPSCRANRFDDVTLAHPLFLWIEALAAEMITLGCSTSPPLYCPDDPVHRADMAVFLVRGIHGAGFVPPPPTGMFADVSTLDPRAPYIEQLFNDGVTKACGTSPLRFCPADVVTREQMAAFLLRAEHGGGYTPPPATGDFDDVPPGHPFAPFIEQLATEGITTGCSAAPPLFCPGAPVTRGQMAVFLVRTFAFAL